MVHLAQIKKNQPSDQDAADRLAAIQLDTPVQDGEVRDGDNYASSVYGSRFAIQQMPGLEMPEREMPRDVAYRLIKDELSLDGNPMLKYVPPENDRGPGQCCSLASFVTTYMV